jgi:hypothetical protein
MQLLNITGMDDLIRMRENTSRVIQLRIQQIRSKMAYAEIKYKKLEQDYTRVRYNNLLRIQKIEEEGIKKDNYWIQMQRSRSLKTGEEIPESPTQTR